MAFVGPPETWAPPGQFRVVEWEIFLQPRFRRVIGDFDNLTDAISEGNKVRAPYRRNIYNSSGVTVGVCESKDTKVPEAGTES